MEESLIPKPLKGTVPRETTRAYQAFVDYCLMGSGRSLRKLLRKYHESTTEPPTRHLETLRDWSRDHKWQARVAVYQKRLSEHRASVKESLRDEIEQQAAIDHNRMLEEWDRRWEEYTDSPKAVPTMSIREMVKMRRDIDDFGRRSVGLPDRIASGKLEGEGPLGEFLYRNVKDLSDEELASIAARRGERTTE